MQILKKRNEQKKRRGGFTKYAWQETKKVNIIHYLIGSKMMPQNFLNTSECLYKSCEILLNLVKDDIMNENTKWRSSIQPEETLALCLR